MTSVLIYSRSLLCKSQSSAELCLCRCASLAVVYICASLAVVYIQFVELIYLTSLLTVKSDRLLIITLNRGLASGICCQYFIASSCFSRLHGQQLLWIGLLYSLRYILCQPRLSQYCTLSE